MDMEQLTNRLGFCVKSEEQQIEQEEQKLSNVLTGTESDLKDKIHWMHRNISLFTHLPANPPGLSKQHQLLLNEDIFWCFPLIGTWQFNDIFHSHSSWYRLEAILGEISCNTMAKDLLPEMFPRMPIVSFASSSRKLNATLWSPPTPALPTYVMPHHAHPRPSMCCTS